MRSLSFLLALSLSLGCGDDDVTPADAGSDPDAGETELCMPATFPPDPGDCTAMASDYSPGADDAWDPCISDDARYHNVEPTISSSARVMAFEEMGAMLFTPAADPTPDAFTAARMIYQEAEGLDSRVVRRYDPHFTAPDGTDCSMAGVPETYPDYCVGPARIQPIVLGALNDGIAGAGPRPSAARIEAALLWFFAISTYKESLTCTTTMKDCDSSYAYYSGGDAARCGIGLARYVAEVDPYAHDRAWDGILAVRCWRDLDSGEVATDTELRDLARDQYDRAVQDGLAAVLRDRLEKLAAGGEEQVYYHAFVQVLAIPVTEEMERRGRAAEAGALRSEVERADPTAVDTAAAIAAIDAVYDCP